MQWRNLSLQQFQQLSELWADGGKDPIDAAVESCCVCYGLTARQVDSLSTSDFKKLCNGLAFLGEVPEWKPVKHFTVEGRRYRFVYDVQQIHAARYMEVKVFGAEGFVQGLHKAAASMVVPQRRTWYGRWVDTPYDAGQHEAYAADVAQAPITAIHGSALFFCKVLADLIARLQAYLTRTMTTTQREETTKHLQTLCAFMGGNTVPA